MARSGMANIITKIRDTINDPYVSIAMSNNESAAATTIELASTTGLNAGDLITLKDDNGSEQTTISSLVKDTSITVPAITNSYTTAASAVVTKGTSVFSDNKIQEFCDENRVVVDYELLNVDTDYTTMWFDWMYFDTDAGLYENDLTTEVTAGESDVFDYMAARFTFNDEQDYAYYIKGHRYLFELIVARCYRELAESHTLLSKYKASKKGSVTIEQKDCFEIADNWELVFQKKLGMVSVGDEGRYD